MRESSFIVTFMMLIFSSSAFCSEDSLYSFKWLDEGEQVYVIQNKEFKKKGRFGIDLGAAQSENSPYYDSLGYLFIGTYYLTENYSLDFTYKKYSNTDSQDLKNLLEVNTNQTKPLLSSVEVANLIHFNWIPFYGKLNVFNQILYFDLGIGAGLGRFNTKSNRKTFNITNIPLTLEDETSNGLSTKIYFKFFTNKKLTFGFAYNLSAYRGITSYKGSEENNYYVDFLANVGYIF